MTMRSTRSSMRGSPRASSHSGDHSSGGGGGSGAYPLPAYLNFCPGGLAYPRPGDEDDEAKASSDGGGGGRSSSDDPASFADSSGGGHSHVLLSQVSDPVRLVSKAMECDVQLQVQRRQQRPGQAAGPHAPPPPVAVEHVPSLSFLLEAIFHPLTGVPAAQVRHWLDSILLSYFSLDTTANMGDDGACSNCTLAAAFTGSTLDITAARGGGASSKGPMAKDVHAMPSLHSRSYSGESSTGSIGSSLGGGGSMSGMSGAGGPYSASSSAGGGGGGTSTSVQFQSLLKHLASHHSGADGGRPPARRPCGYVFKRGDIAWNCRTCQTDPTCVLCDKCFHNSDHEGHEVFFHRTSPGGCCDCGDVEAWRVEGCCDEHRPDVSVSSSGEASGSADGGLAGEDAGLMDLDEYEAIKAALRGREGNADSVRSLPPCLRSALGVVIGAAVKCVVMAIDGAGVGADVSQWKIRWAEQVAKICNKCVHDEEYALSDGSAKTMGAYITPQEILDAAFQPSPGHNASPSPSASPTSTPNTWSGVSAPAGAGGFGAASSSAAHLHSFPTAQGHRSQLLGYPYGQSDHQERRRWEGQFPQNFRLQLRLHNDDVHTFDEVIDALYERSSNNNSGANGNSDSDAEDSGAEGGPGLVSRRDDADSMTHHVDSDGQVTVKSYTSFRSALRGFTRLKARGLLCSVVSTPQVDLEMRARSVLRWLMEMSKLHPGVAALVVHALVDVTGGEDTLVDGCCVWPEPRMACFPWNGTLRSEAKGDDLWWTREDFRLHCWTKKDQCDEKSGSGGMEMDHVVNATTASSSAAYHLRGSSPMAEDFDPAFYSNVPFHLPSESLRKSPHALWGTLPTPIRPMMQAFPDEGRISTKRRRLMIVDTDIRKQQEADTLTKSLHPHRLAGLSILSGVSLLDDGFVHPTTGRIVDCTSTPYTAMYDLTVSEREIQYLIGSQLHGGGGGGKTSYQSPYSPLLLMMLLDPYPTKQFRHAMHSLFLSLLTESRFKARFAASLGVVAYRPLTTLFCAGVGTESDTPLGFTVQILTAGSLVRALGNGSVSASLLECDNDELQEGTRKFEECEQKQDAGTVEVPTFALPIALTILRAIHTNLLGATKEVKMLLENTAPATPAASAVATGGASGSPNAPVPPSLGDDHQVTYRQLQQNMMLSGARSTSSLGYNSTTVPPHSSYGDAATFSAAHAGQGYLPALVYQNGEHPQTTLLPAAPDDGFLDSRSTRHKRLPHLLRDLEYVFETPGTALSLLLQLNKISDNMRKSMGSSAITPALSEKERKVLTIEFPTAFARLLRLAQNMDPQKRKISGGHVEYEQQRWLDAFGLSLNLSGMRDALVESPSLLSSSIASTSESPRRGNASSAISVGSVPKPLRVEGTNRYYLARHAMGNFFTALLREIKLCLYREGLLENGLLPASYTQAHPHHSGGGLTLTEAVQRSTLHVSSPNVVGVGGVGTSSSGSNGVALACATGVKMTEAQLNIIESALRYEYGYYASNASTMDVASGLGASPKSDGTNPGGMGGGVIMGDWLKVPHTPLSGDALSFHLPLHRALARSIKSLCSIPVPDIERNAHPNDWWKLPILDGQDYYMKENDDGAQMGAAGGHSSFFHLHNHLAQLLLPTLRSSNCRVVWNNPDTSPEQNSIRRFRTYTVSSAIAAAKVVHSLADHPLRCLAASNQIEKHLWARNGSAAAGMALNYASAPLCKSFRDLDLCLLQFSAAGFDVGLGARRTLALMLSRFSMDGYLVDPVLRRTSSTSVVVQGKQQWVHPPRLQDPDHAPALAESFFATVCLLVTELPPPPPQSMSDDTALKRSMRRELLHALAAEPRSYSEALAAAVSGATRRDHHLHQSSSNSMDDSTDGSQSLRTIFGDLLREIARERQNTRASMSTRSGGGAPSYELTAQCSDEYDPTFYHLRRSEHQHAMDIVARLRKVKCSAASSTRTDRWGGGGSTGMRTRSMANASVKGDTCLPLVSPPPEAHPRFLPARLILHLPTMDSALRRKLLFALTGGQWLPPPEPQNVEQTLSLQSSTSTEGMSATIEANVSGVGEHMVAESSSGSFRSLRSNSRRSISSTGNASNVSGQPSQDVPFSPAVVASSSVSSLEVLQILTLQVHTLEHCAALHRTQTLDMDSAQLSSTISVNSYLTRLCYVPSSLENCWALQCPSPLPSAGSGQRRGSILGLMIALYEHSYATSGSENVRDGNTRTDGQQGTDDSHSGGARTLASDGLKWLLRFVHALVHGAVSVTAAVNSATDGIPIRQQTGLRSPTNRRLGGAELSPPWTISDEIQTTIQGMLENLPKLWPADERSSVSSKTGVPKSHGASSSPGSSASGVSPISGSEGGRSSMTKIKMEARKAAQLQALERMREQQKKFAASLMSADDKDSEDMDVDSENDNDEEEIDCIICRCAADDSDSPLGFLGHVQRSRMLQLRSLAELSGGRSDDSAKSSDGLLFRAARVVGDRGCQLRATACMDSDPVACLPHGSIVNILQSKVSPKYGLLSRRVLVRHVAQDEDNNEHVVEGWASVQSSQGYVILSPLSRLCYSRWGSTRPILRLCGHAAHADCVEAHCLSLHQRAAGDHPYDGRFAANIEEGEFLCPLCKQLSNVLVPKHSLNAKPSQKGTQEEHKDSAKAMMVADDLDVLRDVLVQRQLDRATELATRAESEHDDDKASRKEREASKRFGSQLSEAMQISWENHGAGKRRNKQWLQALGKWDYEDDDESVEESTEESDKSSRKVGKVLRILREQHIAWASVGHGAASAEASTRTTQSNARDGSKSSATNASSAISDPWTGYDHHSRDSHPNLLELRRVIEATSGFLEVVGLELAELYKDEHSDSGSEKVLSLDSKGAAGVALVGQMLFDALSGQPGGVASSMLSPPTDVETKLRVGEWRLLSALVASMPCHVARDGIISQRHEARATAAAMWAAKGHGTASIGGHQSSMDDSARPSSIPPAPLCVKTVCEGSSSDAYFPVDDSGSKNLSDGWGTSNLLKALSENNMLPRSPFRPLIASAFMCQPILAWDLSTFAGALISSLLYTGSTVKGDELASAVRILLVARMVQALITPNGYLAEESCVLDSSSASVKVTAVEKWSPDDEAREARALASLRSHCIRKISGDDEGKADEDSSMMPEDDGARLLTAVGNAVLPFARTLVLLVRAALSTLRQKQRKLPRVSGTEKTNKCISAEKKLQSMVENSSVMGCGDGLHILRALGGPAPTDIMLCVSSEGKSHQNEWLRTIDRWLAGVTALESHHGSRGCTTHFDTTLKKWIPSYAAASQATGSLEPSEREPKHKTPESVIIKSIPGGNSGPRSSGADVQRATGNTNGAGPDAMDDDGSGGRSVDLSDPDAMLEGDPDPAADLESFDEDDEEYEDEDMDDDDDEEENDDNSEDAMQAARFPVNFGGMVDDDDMESDEEMDAEGPVNFDEALGDPVFFGLPRRALSSSAEWKDEDEESSECSANSSYDGATRSVDREFVDVSRAAIIPFQPSLLALESIGPGPRGNSLDMSAASSLMYDMSHLGLVHRNGVPGSSLVRLPRSFVELYSLVNKVKGDALDDQDEGTSSETAICLVTGVVMRSGSVRRAFSRGHTRPPGACTIHARKVGSGIGIFFLVQKCTVLLMHNNKSAYSASLYVDENGEEDPGLRRGRPLFLQESKYEALEALWRQHGIPREVAQIRSTSDRVIRDNWY